jgi:hypothetical protein
LVGSAARLDDFQRRTSPASVVARAAATPPAAFGRELPPLCLTSARPITEGRLRYRRIATSNVSGSWANNSALQDLVFRNPTTSWAEVKITAGATKHVFTGLTGGIWQFQLAWKNGHGWSPWSTNCARNGDEQAKAGLPAGPRAVIFVN